VRALLLDARPAHIALAERMPRGWTRRLVTTAAGPLRLASLPEPAPPSREWVPLRPLLAGICGTDLAALTGRLSRRLLAFASLPAVPGHEVVAHDPDGRLVAVDPLLPCAVRGLPPCRACAAGRPSACERFRGGGIATAMYLGFCRDLPGGWGEAMLAHPSQIHPVPEAVPPRRAVLAEPLAIAMHGALQAPAEPGERVGVVGAGTIGLCVAAALRMLGFGGHVTVLARHPLQGRTALRLGATQVGAGPEERFDLVFECGGGASSVREALARTEAGGRVVLLGSAAQGSLDWSEVWARERRLFGSTGYGPEPARGGRHTFDLALEALADGGALPLDDIVTGVYQLDGWRAALTSAFDHRRHLKVVFAPQGRV
jgi:threonine dehydrogenase-like Zn-dependent dehydrogenase